MADAQREKLRQIIQALEGAGALRTGEIAFDDVLLCAEMDDEYSDIDIYDVVRVLSARASIGIRGELFGQNLDRNVALEARVARAIDGPHRARPHERENPVWAEL